MRRSAFSCPVSGLLPFSRVGLNVRFGAFLVLAGIFGVWVWLCIGHDVAIPAQG